MRTKPIIIIGWIVCIIDIENTERHNFSYYQYLSTERTNVLSPLFAVTEMASNAARERLLHPMAQDGPAATGDSHAHHQHQQQQQRQQQQQQAAHHSQQQQQQEAASGGGGVGSGGSVGAAAVAAGIAHQQQQHEIDQQILEVSVNNKHAHTRRSSTTYIINTDITNILKIISDYSEDNGDRQTVSLECVS